MADKYLNKLENAKKNFSDFKRGYKAFGVLENIPKHAPLKQGLNFKNFKNYLTKAARVGDIFSALDTVALYEMKSDLPINRDTTKRLLYKAYLNSGEKLTKSESERAYNQLRHFLKTHPESEEVKNPLEKILTTVGILFLFGSFFFLSSNVTGNVLGLTNKTSNFIGIPLFLLGLGLIIFCFKHK